MQKLAKTFILVAALVGVVGVAQTATAVAAKAPRWKVAGAFLGSAVTKDKVSVSIGTIDFKFGGLTLSTTTCSIQTGSIIGTAAGVAGITRTKLNCTGVKVVGNESCTVKGNSTTAGTVITNALTGTLVYLKKKTTNGAESVGVLAKPESGTEFANLEITGAECSLAGRYPVTGEVVSKMLTPGETEVTTSELEFPTTRIASYYANGETETATAVNALKDKANEATFTGKFKVELESKEKVGVFPG